MKRIALLLLTLIATTGLFAQDEAPSAAALPAGAVEIADAEPGFQEQLDKAFGKLLDWVGYVPFFNLARLINADEPHLDENGLPVISPKGEAVTTSLPLVVVWLVVAAFFFTISFRFVNFRMFGHATRIIRGKYDNPDDAGEVTHFQAFTAALSATVGLGNIAGVAIAVSIGGPGATIWMILAGFLGMSLKFSECTLGQKYRKIDAEGRVSGGPMHYLRDGLKEKGWGGLGIVLSIVFAIFCIGGSLAGGNSFQVNQSLNILQEKVPFFVEYNWVYGLVMATVVGIVIIGGIKRIAQTAEKIVPAMCSIYVLAALTILLTSFDQIPTALGVMWDGAMTGDAVYGGAIGALILGFKRAAFSNEAGVGSAAIAHAAAKTEYPIREGMVAMMGPFIDTVIICTMTALVMVITGVYDYTNPAYAELIATEKGAALTQKAFETIPFLASWFPWVLMCAVVLFAFSTMISWSYYGERCCTTLFGQRSSLPYKLLFLVFVVLGSVISAKNILEFGDLMILLMAFPNIIGLYFLSKDLRSDLRVYEAELSAGKYVPNR